MPNKTQADSLGKAMAHRNYAMHKIASTYPPEKLPSKKCMQCGKALPFFHPKSGRIVKSLFCVTNKDRCKQQYKADQNRTKPKVNRGTRRSGLL